MKYKVQLAKEFTTLLDSETIDARDSSAKQRATDRAFIAGFEAAIYLLLSQLSEDLHSSLDIGEGGAS